MSSPQPASGTPLRTLWKVMIMAIAALGFGAIWLTVEMTSGRWLPWWSLLAALDAIVMARILHLPRNRNGALAGAAFVLLASLTANYGLAALLLGGELGLQPGESLVHGSPRLVANYAIAGNGIADCALYAIGAALAAVWCA